MCANDHFVKEHKEYAEINLSVDVNLPKRVRVGLWQSIDISVTNFSEEPAMNISCLIR